MDIIKYTDENLTIKNKLRLIKALVKQIESDLLDKELEDYKG